MTAGFMKLRTFPFSSKFPQKKRLIMEDSDSLYTQVCSARTVQSDKKGFFSEFFQEVRDTCGDTWLKNRFGKLKTDQERVLSLFNDPEVCDPVLGILENVKPVYKQKDATFSLQRRLQAEKAFLLEDYDKALILLNQAVVRSPAQGTDILIDNGLTLALSFWTRSAVFLELKDGEKAITDLKLATINGLDLKHNAEYYLRTAKAYALLGENAKSKIALAIAERLSQGDKNKICKSQEEISKIDPILNKTPKLSVPNLTGGENPNLENASVLVQVSESFENGKYITAKNNIKTGDIVLVEKPIAACLLPSLYGSHCHHCFTKLTAPVGCPNCSGLAFCSQECMTEAVSSYHQYECEFQDLFIGSGMSILCYMALRIITQSKNVNEAINNSEKIIANLCTHSNLRQPEDFLQRTLMAAFLLRCLQKADYFGKRKSEAVNPIGQELHIASVLLGLLQLLQFNAHEIYETIITKGHKFDGSKPVYIGAGIYKTGSYFNHDCCPGLARFFVGKSLILACTRPIRAGEVIPENYGPIFTRMGLKERQQSLKSRYWFKCTCDACRENWPLLTKIEQNVRFRCTSAGCENKLKYPKDVGKDIRCAQCRKNISLKESVATIIKVEDLYRLAANAMQDQNTEEAIRIFEEAIDLFHEVAFLPHRDTLIAQESLRACFADTGTTFDFTKEKEKEK